MRGETPAIKASMRRARVQCLVRRHRPRGGGLFNPRRHHIGFLGELIADRKRPLIILADHATFHHSKQVRDYVRAHRSQLRVFFLPKRASEFKPDEQVWNEVKNNRIGKQPVKNN